MRSRDTSPERNFYSVTLDRSVHGKELGVAVDFSQDKLRIRAINDGMIKKFNEMNTCSVRTGDEILKVNDVTGDAKKMALACKTEATLRLLMCKGMNINSITERESKRAKIDPPTNSAPSRGLYDFLPAANPKNDDAARKHAERLDVSTCDSFAPHRALFLDIDGVLRPLQGSYNVTTITIDGIQIPLAGCGSDFLGSAMSALRLIVKETGAQLVLSSEWRRHPTLREGVQDALRLAELPPLTGDTTIDISREMGTGNPVTSFAERRVREIAVYLKANPSITSWVAIDDIDLVVDSRKTKLSMDNNFVKTEEDVGLTLKLAQRAIEILKRK